MTGTALRTVDLVANSARRARYTLTLYAISDGFVIEKRSSAIGKKALREAWFRERYVEAEKKFNLILKDKTNQSRKSPRKYRIDNTAESQLPLFKVA
ncbi:hypothetical protein [Geotalea sp. SG265]|uniref:hypothetical protein n=1 Tax=Geotalea sp. SG265 TaxID=2922867 RepID=UPI001FAEEF73|nr:hypothetical protein [Geotalea sp. SG265]